MSKRDTSSNYTQVIILLLTARYWYPKQTCS